MKFLFYSVFLIHIINLPTHAKNKSPQAVKSSEHNLDKNTLNDVATEFIELELAGWRLPNPTQKCLDEVKVKWVKNRKNTNEELPSQSIKDFDPKKDRYKITGLNHSENDRTLIKVAFIWKNIQDSFSFVLNEVDVETLGPASMIDPPKELIVKKNCR